MAHTEKATRIDLFSISTPQMRAFHMSWLAFFSVFFAWFGIAPLMPLVREDLGLSQNQIGHTMVASVAATVFVRVLIGPLCDRYGARLVYSVLLMAGSIPVMLIGLADSYETFLLFRLAIGSIGAAFVVTQYHTSVMFAPNIVGTANATTAGWGNLGGGVTQIVMPLVLAGFVALGATASEGWRLAMVVPGVALFLLGIAYYFFTQDSPAGNYRDLRRLPHTHGKQGPRGMESFRIAAGDSRVWALFVAYAACFGLELTLNNIAVLYFHDRFTLSLETAGLLAGLFGMMNIFARTLGGWLSDRWGRQMGLNGRVQLLFSVLLAEGFALITFSRLGLLVPAVAALMVCSLFIQMGCGATFGLVPFVNRKALGSVSGIVGAGGNVGAVLAGFLFGIEALAFEQSFLYIGIAVLAASVVSLLIRFTPAESAAAAEVVAGSHAVATALPERKLAKVG